MASLTAYGIILAGGGGTRLWPASRRDRPKQFLSLGQDKTLLEATVDRTAMVFGEDQTLIVTSAEQAFGGARPGGSAAC